MMSASCRRVVRGGYTRAQFLAVMVSLGFEEVEATRAANGGFVLHEFTHPRSQERFQVRGGVSYARAVREFSAAIA